MSDINDNPAAREAPIAKTMQEEGKVLNKEGGIDRYEYLGVEITIENKSPTKTLYYQEAEHGWGKFWQGGQRLRDLLEHNLQKNHRAAYEGHAQLLWTFRSCFRY